MITLMKSALVSFFSLVCFMEGAMLSVSFPMALTAMASTISSSTPSSLSSLNCHSSPRKPTFVMPLNGLFSRGGEFERKLTSLSAINSDVDTNANEYTDEEFTYEDDEPKVTPITILSGFLGSGKTTLLQHLLHNKQGLKIAVVVNDVASVNIDSKLVLGSSSSTNRNDYEGNEGIVELSNGCACCSLSDELLTSLAELVTLSDLRGKGAYDHIVIELSGVAEPKEVRAKFQDAMLYQMPLMERVQLDTMVTVVDCASFLQHLKSGKAATPDSSPELFFRTEEERIAAENAKEDLKDLPPGLMEALGSVSSFTNTQLSHQSSAAVVDLLIGQTETADVLVLNKIDQCELPEEVEQVKRIVEVLNPRADLITTTFGRVEHLEDILGAMGGQGIVEAGIVDDHSDAVAAALSDMKKSKEKESTPVSHDHSHDQSSQCSDPDCTDPSHSHDHSHAHSHHHEENEEHSCNDPDCTDSTHDHSHTHSHSHNHRKHDAISSFVYQARRPFHPHRLLHSVLNQLPITKDKVSKEMNPSEDNKELFASLLRSKGFCWLANSNIAALYWSHAGTSFEMECLGRWWATLARDEWPEETKEAVLKDFDDVDHDENKPLSESVGDRRQEVVLIGTFAKDTQRKMCSILDDCLLTDEEWDIYVENCHDEELLSKAFPNAVKFRIATY